MGRIEHGRQPRVTRIWPVIAASLLLPACTAQPNGGACPVLVTQTHYRPDLPGDPSEVVELDPPLLGGPYRVEMTSLAGRDADGPRADVAFYGAPGWGESVVPTHTGPDAQENDWTVDNRVEGEDVFASGQVSVGLTTAGEHVVELASLQTACSATLVFEVLFDPGSWVPGED